MKTIGWAFTFIFCLGSVAFATTRPTLQNVKTYTQGSDFVTELHFSKPPATDAINVEFVHKTIQVNIPGASMAAKKNVQKVSGKTVKMVYTYQPSPRLMRARIILNSDANTYKGHVNYELSGKTLKILLRQPQAVASSQKNVSTAAAAPDVATIPPLSLEDSGAEIASPAAAPAVVAAKTLAKTDQGVTSEKLEKRSDLKKQNLKESQIPVLVNESKKAGGVSHPFLRMILSLFIICGVAVGLILFAKWWTRSHKSNPLNTKIRILTQHHIGPKKTLAIVQVAGEALLIGITDHNISMLKTLSLIDDEVPETVPSDFQSSLSQLEDESVGVELQPKERVGLQTDSFVDEVKDKVTIGQRSARADDFSYGSVKDIISNRLRGMRPL